MKIETRLNCGDRAWVFGEHGSVQLTVGQLVAKVTDSPGIEQHGIVFDNYAPQKEYREEYMCVETGIGSGSVYTLGEHIFATKEECDAANAERAARRESERLRNERLKKESLIEQAAYFKRQLELAEAAKAELAEGPQP